MKNTIRGRRLDVKRPPHNFIIGNGIRNFRKKRNYMQFIAFYVKDIFRKERKDGRARIHAVNSR